MTLMEGTPTGSWGGKTHAVDPTVTHGTKVRLGVALCGTSVYISRQPWDPPIKGLLEFPGGYCMKCIKANRKDPA